MVDYRLASLPFITFKKAQTAHKYLERYGCISVKVYVKSLMVCHWLSKPKV